MYASVIITFNLEDIDMSCFQHFHECCWCFNAVVVRRTEKVEQFSLCCFNWFKPPRITNKHARYVALSKAELKCVFVDII